MRKSFVEAVEGKKVLFITTKNIDYIRNSQEIRILESRACSVKKIYSCKNGYVGRIIEIWIKLFFCKVSKYDCVFIGFAPQLIFPFFWKFRRNEIIIDFFISVYDTLVNDRKKLRPKGIAAYLCHKLDSYVTKAADIIISDTRADKEYFIKEFCGDRKKYEVLYLEADRMIYYPRKSQEKHNDKFVVLYFGSILPLQGVDTVLEAAKLLKGNNNILIQIIGPVSLKHTRPVQENIEYIDWLSQEELAEHINNADLCLAGHFNADIDKAKRTIPGKAYIYDAMEKKMILGDNPANREIFSETDQVYFVPMGNPERLKECIEAISCTYIK